MITFFKWSHIVLLSVSIYCLLGLFIDLLTPFTYIERFSSIPDFIGGFFISSITWCAAYMGYRELELKDD